jgi:hypothetical protein
MHNPGPFHRSTVNLYDFSTNLKPRDFIGTLFKVGGEKCVLFLGEGLKSDPESFKFCRNELMVASSCILLNKANINFGDLRDNVGLCKFEIELAKNNLRTKFDSFNFKELDEWFRELSLSNKSFC